MKLVVITVNFHNQEETIACLRSFKSQKNEEIDASYFVVDNGSTDISSKRLREELSDTEIILSSKNLGFAGGCNLAIRKAKERGFDYVLLVNPDALVKSEKFLASMVDMGADIVAPLIKYRRGGKTLYDFGGKVDYLFGRNTHITSTSRTFSYENPDYFTGACLLIKMEVFKSIGLLDEGFFLYYEDADFCLRAIQAGFTQKLCPKAILFHHLSTTTSKLGKNKLTTLANSHLRFCRKHLSMFAAPFYLSFNLYLRFKSFFP